MSIEFETSEPLSDECVDALRRTLAASAGYSVTEDTPELLALRIADLAPVTGWAADVELLFGDVTRVVFHGGPRHQRDLVLELIRRACAGCGQDVSLHEI